MGQGAQTQDVRLSIKRHCSLSLLTGHWIAFQAVSVASVDMCVCDSVRTCVCVCVCDCPSSIWRLCKSLSRDLPGRDTQSSHASFPEHIHVASLGPKRLYVCACMHLYVYLHVCTCVWKVWSLA